MFEAIEKVNKVAAILMRKDGLPLNLIYPDNFSTFQFKDAQGNIYINLESEQEKDYEVVYISRLERLN